MPRTAPECPAAPLITPKPGASQARTLSLRDVFPCSGCTTCCAAAILWRRPRPPAVGGRVGKGRGTWQANWCFALPPVIWPCRRSHRWLRWRAADKGAMEVGPHRPLPYTLQHHTETFLLRRSHTTHPVPAPAGACAAGSAGAAQRAAVAHQQCDGTLDRDGAEHGARHVPAGPTRPGVPVQRLQQRRRRQQQQQQQRRRQPTAVCARSAARAPRAPACLVGTAACWTDKHGTGKHLPKTS